MQQNWLLMNYCSWRTQNQRFLTTQVNILVSLIDFFFFFKGYMKTFVERVLSVLCVTLLKLKMCLDVFSELFGQSPLQSSDVSVLYSGAPF